MRLKQVHIKNYRSVEDSEPFTIGDVTCLVGKNEAGKTAVLNALHQLRPYGEEEEEYDKVIDYPRRFRAEYKQRHGGSEALVCSSDWSLSDAEVAALTNAFGEGAYTGANAKISKYYGSVGTHWNLPVNEKVVLENMMKRHRFDAVEAGPLKDVSTTAAAAKILSELTSPSDKQSALLDEIKKFPGHSALSKARAILDATTPRFKLFSHFDRMSGEVQVEKILADRANGRLSRSDAIFLQFLEYAGTDLEDISGADRYEELKSECESASNRLTDQIFEYWSQNTALEVEVDVSPGRAGDPAPFDKGTVIRSRVKNTNHRASVPFSERSAGFIWFFSFLVEFTQIKNEDGNVIILLDEPGLTLHGKAQRDLLRYIYEKLKPHHQVIFTTHSPFLIPSEDLSAVRVVEDVIKPTANGRVEVHGTKVRSDTLATDRDTLFPLQGALGYDIAQSLFIGEHTLLVEGPSDILFLKAASRALEKQGGTRLDPRWVICPSGGIDKLQPFISLFGGNGLHVAALSDFGPTDRRKVEQILSSNILKSGHFFTTSDFLDQDHSDIEDFFGPEAYVEIVNSSYKLKPKLKIEDLSDVEPKSDRIVKMVEGVFRLRPAWPEFDHFGPASWYFENPEEASRILAEHPEAGARFEKLFIALNQLL
jgi:energy-coupling factor transporter ATP-binding protein EcfA2